MRIVEEEENVDGVRNDRVAPQASAFATEAVHLGAPRDEKIKLLAPRIARSYHRPFPLPSHETNAHSIPPRPDRGGNTCVGPDPIVIDGN
jgi:hypothetical protein